MLVTFWVLEVGGGEPVVTIGGFPVVVVVVDTAVVEDEVGS